ncbi:MAG TPA: SDR family NAD(P)-dependent oxidoreductase [Gemmatimonadales bacterium]|nr:SDR family NAD(P)-dependent oxidoreductase [Gemmatimonadales bacterium]
MAQTVLVTGASSGIGQAIAQLLTARGYTVYGTSRKPTGSLIPLDVRSDESVRACVDRVGAIDVLVNNAGYSLMGSAEETSVDEAKAQLETNFFGVVRMVKAVLPAMRQARAGKIITIGSLAGITAIPFGAFYTASKFALEGYTEALWHELRPFGIHVTLIEPGFIATPIGESTQIAAAPLAAYNGVRQRATAALDQHVKDGISPDAVAKRVLRVIQSRAPSLRYRVGTHAAWFPRLKSVLPWPLFAVGVRRTFAV